MQQVTINSISHNGKSPSQMDTSIGTLLIWPDKADKFEAGGVYELEIYNKPYNGQDQYYVSTKHSITRVGHDDSKQQATAPKPANIGSQPTSIVMECINIAARMGFPAELEANTKIVQELYAKLTKPELPPEPTRGTQPIPESGVGSDLDDDIGF